MGRNRKRRRDRRGRPEYAHKRVGIDNGGHDSAHPHSHSQTNGREHTGTAKAVPNFYNAEESARYTVAERRTGIQDELAIRVLHHLLCAWSGPQSSLPPFAVVVNVGIGAGACADVVDQQVQLQRRHSGGENRHAWHVVGLDKSQEMLHTGARANSNRDLMRVDFCHGLPFRDAAGCVDAIFSVSALQWLCTDPGDDRPLRRFMRDAIAVLRAGGAMIAQVYPATPQDSSRLLAAAQKAGFAAGDRGNERESDDDSSGGGSVRVGHSLMVMDMPHPNKTKRFFLHAVKPGVRNAASKGDSKTAVDLAMDITHTPCPCAWPHEACCASMLQGTAIGAWNDTLGVLERDEAKHSSSTTVEKKDPAAATKPKSRGPPRRRKQQAAAAGTAATNSSQKAAWEERLQREHTLAAKTMQATVQALWLQQFQQHAADRHIDRRRLEELHPKGRRIDVEARTTEDIRVVKWQDRYLCHQPPCYLLLLMPSSCKRVMLLDDHWCANPSGMPAAPGWRLGSVETKIVPEANTWYVSRCLWRAKPACQQIA